MIYVGYLVAIMLVVYDEKNKGQKWTTKLFFCLLSWGYVAIYIIDILERIEEDLKRRGK